MKGLQIFIIIAFVQGIPADNTCPEKPCSSQDGCSAFCWYCTQCESDYSVWTCRNRPGYTNNTCDASVCGKNCDDNGGFCSIQSTGTDGVCRCSMDSCNNEIHRSGTGSGYYFEITNTYGTQYEAKQYCISRGGRLAEPKNATITNDIKTIVEGTQEFYYSGLERNNNGDWAWSDGTTTTSLSYSNWRQDQTANNGVNIGGTGSCMAISQFGDWLDWECGRTELFICQYVDVCASGPCQNGGSCTTTGITTYTCSCLDGYDGDNCENGICEKQSPCENGGTCTNTGPNTYECSCAVGYYGDNCTDEICEALTPCENGGTCTNTDPNTYECSCAIGFYGNNCTVRICEALPPCENEGTCMNTGPNTYICSCIESYYGDNCTELLVISSPAAVTGVASERLVIELNITTTEGGISVNLTKDGDMPVTILTSQDGGNTTYVIDYVTLDDEGSYTFMAYPENTTYTASTVTNVTVHVRAYIEEVESDLIYAPQSDNDGCERTITCKVGGIPKPDIGWYRNEAELETSSENDVYQDIGDQSATLHVENANRSDAGEYRCQASNTVANEATISTDNANITLAVYGAPADVLPEGKKCSEDGQITVNWKADEHTAGVNHTFTITPLNGSMEAYNGSETAVSGEEVRFTNLNPSTQYKVKVVVCPEIGCCIDQLNNSGTATTGHGIPYEVASADFSQSISDICNVTWTAPDTFADQVVGYNITWTESIKEQVVNTVGDELHSDSVDSPRMTYAFRMSPNRKYNVSVSARSCAGNGVERIGVGSCFTNEAGPDMVPEPTVSADENGRRQPTRNATINIIDDESNGPLSCVFVVLYKRGADPPLPTTLDDLQTLSSNALENKNLAQGYLAIALKRSQINIGEEVNVTLGDKESSECDVLDTQTNSKSRETRNTGDSTMISAINLPLGYNGDDYIMVTTTSTPTGGITIIVVNSDIQSFKQGINEDTPNLLPLYVVILIVIVASVAVTVWMYYRRKSRKQLNEDGSSQMPLERQQRVDDISGGSIGGKTSTTNGLLSTTIALDDLLNYYISMEANECMMFREQYGGLKQKAKRTAPSSAYAASEKAMAKNRFRNILPYDDNRVHLQGVGAETYINASYIQGHKKKFIATQGPLPHTITDFWRMIVEQRSRIIVMLTKCDEMGRRKCEKYWPSANERVSYGSFEIVNVMEKELGGIVKRVMKVHVPDQGEFTITQYHYVRWPDHGVPMTTSAFFRLHRQVMAEYQELREESPIVVHCSAGVGRTGTFIAFDILIGQIKKNVDIYNCVLDMRKQRVDMVQTSEQYQMLHKLVLERHLFANEDVEGKDLPKKRKHLSINEELRKLRESESLNAKPLEYSTGNRSNVVIVRQPEDTEWVTINATFVEAYNERINFIASEGPSNSTVEYFLRALWDNQVDAIVMLNTPAVDKRRYEVQYCEYWPTKPGQTLTYNNITITHLSEHEIRGSVERTFQLQRRNHQSREVRQYQYLGWTNDDPPEKGDGIIDLIARIDAIDLGRPATVLVHCTDGLGKTGVFIAVANIIERMKAENRVDIFRTVKDLRDVRPGLVKSNGDYQRCYDIALYYISQQNSYENSGFQQGEQEHEVKDPIYQNL